MIFWPNCYSLLQICKAQLSLNFYTTEFTPTTEFMSTEYFFQIYEYMYHPKPNLNKPNLT